MFYNYVARPKAKQQLLNEGFSSDINDLNHKKVNDLA